MVTSGIETLPVPVEWKYCVRSAFEYVGLVFASASNSAKAPISVVSPPAVELIPPMPW